MGSVDRLGSNFVIKPISMVRLTISEEDDDRTLAEMISQIKEESANIAKAVADLEKLIGEVDE